MTKSNNDREQTHREYCLVNQFDTKNITQYLAMCAQSKTIWEFQNAFHLNFFCCCDFCWMSNARYKQPHPMQNTFLTTL